MFSKKNVAMETWRLSVHSAAGFHSRAISPGSFSSDRGTDMPAAVAPVAIPCTAKTPLKDVVIFQKPRLGVAIPCTAAEAMRGVTFRTLLVPFISTNRSVFCKYSV